MVDPISTEHQMEGELKRIKNFFSSRKDIYKLNRHLMMIKIGSGKQQTPEYRLKYDLSMYSIRLSKSSKDVFYLEPLDAAAHLEL